MAKVYGGRWQVLGEAGQGGQSQVFKVKNLRDASEPCRALKRVLNPKRRERFLSEIEAIKRLDHPSVIKLIDHAALDASPGEGEKQYLVMPFAEGGDLSHCAGRYKGNLDGTLIVARQLASALQAAHNAQIIHRDVKPANVLFTGPGNEVWLTDFGICILTDQERQTHDREMVGPWSFVAPELEGGGQLEVSPAADVYSLGKLIFFMVSGGVVLPRERLSEPRYTEVFKDGGRYHHLRLLLEGMICPLSQRLPDMQKVLERVEQITSWDSTSIAAPVSPKAFSAIERLSQKAAQGRHVLAENTLSMQAEQARDDRIREQVTEWLVQEQEKLVSVVESGGAFTATVTVNAVGSTPLAPSYFCRASIDLCVEDGAPTYPSKHVLRLNLCQSMGVRILSAGSTSLKHEPQDKPLFLVPTYGKAPVHLARSKQDSAPWYFGPGPKLVAVPAQKWGHTPFSYGAHAINPEVPEFLSYRFMMSSWPLIEQTLRVFLTKVFEEFLQVVDQRFDQPSPY